jgi:hypothetical protein
MIAKINPANVQTEEMIDSAFRLWWPEIAKSLNAAIAERAQCQLIDAILLLYYPCDRVPCSCLEKAPIFETSLCVVAVCK